MARMCRRHQAARFATTIYYILFLEGGGGGRGGGVDWSGSVGGNDSLCLFVSPYASAPALCVWYKKNRGLLRFSTPLEEASKRSYDSVIFNHYTLSLYTLLLYYYGITNVQWLERWFVQKRKKKKKKKMTVLSIQNQRDTHALNIVARKKPTQSRRKIHPDTVGVDEAKVTVSLKHAYTNTLAVLRTQNDIQASKPASE